jgi:N-acetylmuramoyl-L-alanine amidase
LIEAGYLTNPEEAKKLNSRSFQKSLAAGIGRGIRSYFYDKPPQGSIVAWQKKNGVLPTSYTVRRGENLSLIAKHFGFSIDDIKTANKLKSDVIFVGQVLSLPVMGLPILEHTVSGGETLSQIAQSYGVNLGLLREKNELQTDRIIVGQILYIPRS